MKPESKLSSDRFGTSLTQRHVVDDLDNLIEVLPLQVREPLKSRVSLNDLLEIILD